MGALNICNNHLYRVLAAQPEDLPSSCIRTRIVIRIIQISRSDIELMQTNICVNIKTGLGGNEALDSLKICDFTFTIIIETPTGSLFIDQKTGGRQAVRELSVCTKFDSL